MGYGAVTFGFAYLLAPERILSFPRSSPDRFLLVISLYPFLSVLGQEIAYRLLFFERYGCLFQNRASAILLSAVVFAVAHGFYQNWVAVILSSGRRAGLRLVIRADIVAPAALNFSRSGRPDPVRRRAGYLFLSRGHRLKAGTERQRNGQFNSTSHARYPYTQSALPCSFIHSLASELRWIDAVRSIRAFS